MARSGAEWGWLWGREGDMVAGDPFARERRNSRRGAKNAAKRTQIHIFVAQEAGHVVVLVENQNYGFFGA